MRVLLYEFIQSAETARRAAAVVRKAGVDVVGWVVRPRVEHYVVAAMPEVRRFPVDYPVPAHGGRRFLPELSAEDEELLRLMLDREGRFQSALHLGQVAGELVSYAQWILDETRPDAVFFSDVPHNALSYALFSLARAQGACALFLKRGPAPHHFTFADDVMNAVEAALSHDRPMAELSSRGARFLDHLVANYETARPAYMHRQAARSTWGARLKRLAAKPADWAEGRVVRNAVTHIRRDILKREYESLATARIDGAPYVAVFLHLQPERTTLPEGGRFAQQWRIVHALSAALPTGWRILVREHPSTFLTGARLMRGRWSYEGLLRIPRVEIVSTTIDPFLLVDQSTVVATVTGTVGLEAVARGKPTLAFGSAPFLGCRGVFRVRRDAEAADAISAAQTCASPGRTDVREYLQRFEASPRAFLGTYDGDNFPAYWASGEAQEGVLQQMLAHALAPGAAHRAALFA